MRWQCLGQAGGGGGVRQTGEIVREWNRWEWVQDSVCVCVCGGCRMVQTSPVDRWLRGASGQVGLDAG